MAGAFVNGEYFAFADIFFSFQGLPIIGIKSINYSDTLGRKYVRGAARKPIGTTSGQYEATCDFEIYLPVWNTILPIIQELGLPFGGWKRYPFDINVSYASDQPTSTLIPTSDLITTATIMKVDVAQSESDEPLVRKITMFPQEVLWGGAESSVLEPEKMFSIG
jgi:hypothetical protein